MERRVVGGVSCFLGGIIYNAFRIVGVKVKLSTLGKAEWARFC